MGSSYSPRYGGQGPLQKRKGLKEGTERKKESQIQDRGGYKQSTNHKPQKLSTRPWQPHGHDTGEEASLATTVDARELTRRGGCREEQTAPVKQRNRPFDADYFLGLQDDTELTIRLYKNIEEFEFYLKSALVPASGVEKLVKILHKVIACELQRESILKILQVVCSSRFLDQHLQTYIDHLQKFSKKDEITEVVEKVLDLLSSICHRLPSERSKVYLIMNYIKSQSNLVSVLCNSPVVAKQFEEVLVQSRKLLTTQRKGTGAGSKGTRNEDDEIPSEDFVDLPVFPDKQDLDHSKMPFLRRSKTVGAFKDAHHYLDVHFRLLREDFLRPLRNGIREVKAEDQNDLRLKNMDVRLYQNVRIIGIVPGNTLDYEIQFDIRPFKKVRWQSSKRLIFGSLVCLSDDNFDTVFFAVITNRENEKIEKGVIQVCFETQTGEVSRLSNERLFTMVESVSFFEANRHVLEGLKQMKDMIPMSRYIVECQQEVNPPSYLTAQGKQVTMNLTALTGTTRHVNVENVPVINFDEWPDIDWNLNVSQLEAVRMALTKELAIIQGPPGTGKTYVGLKIVQVLLDNARVWNSDSSTRPILIVCYTNHALDQFLEGMLKFCPKDIVRVGSRSQSETLSPFNINEMKRRLRESGDMTTGHIFSSMYECRGRMKELAEDITNTKTVLEENLSHIFNVKDLKSHIPRQQYQSLTSRSAAVGSSLMSVWLCGGVIVKDEKDFPETDHYDQLAQKVISQILWGEDDFDQNYLPANICSKDFSVRAQMYRSWVKKTKQRLLHEVQRAKEVHISPKALEEWLEAAEVEILPDHILQPDIDKLLFKAITCRKGLSRDIYAPYFVRFWLGIDQINRKYEDLEIVLNDLLKAPKGDMRGYCQVNETSYGRQVTHSLPDVHLQPALPTVHAGKNCPPEKKTKMREIKDGANKLNIDEEAEILQKQRLLDDDENDEVTQMFREKESAEGITDSGDTKVSNWKVVNRQIGRKFRKILHLLKTLTPLSEEEAAMVTDVWDISLDVTARVRLYLSWLQKHQKTLTSTITTLADSYAAESRMLSELNMERDGLILKRAKVIGMTTTAAAKYRRLLATVGCPIVIMEEAAEVLEAHVVTTLSSSCQHLILIGDHQQLRPSPTVYELCRDYHLDLSLFERLVNNDLPHSTLTLQHRMRPEVARLVRHVYPDLQDHPTTRDRPHVRGMKHDVFFFHHEVDEDSDVDGTSKSNDHEAKLCVALCRYLVQQGYSTESITILVAYTGQIFAVKKFITKDQEFYSGVRVTSIDNYQGEENDIIILSLVRSNKEGKVGFLKTDNRVCVAVSRAKIGLYAFGNFRILSANSQLWKEIIKTAKVHKQFGLSLAIRCENHPDREILVYKAEDFKKSPEGGCMLPCAAELECGHTCHLLCHGYDRNHEEYKCMESCPTILCELGHQCPQKCHMPCQPCMMIISKIIPECGHTISIACSKTPNRAMCQENCNKILSCGHTIFIACSKFTDRVMCQETCKKILSCGHTIFIACSKTTDRVMCQETCKKILSCGHTIFIACSKTTDQVMCQETCKKILSCGHTIFIACSKTTDQVMCQETCKKILSCGHTISFACCKTPDRTMCQEDCQKMFPCGHMCSGQCGTCHTKLKHECTVEVERSWPCGHTNITRCNVIPEKNSCPRKCKATQKCGHACSGSCGKCFGRAVHKPCIEKCLKPLPGCDHRCEGRCGDPCPPCRRMNTFSCSHGWYGNCCGEPFQPCRRPCPFKCPHKLCRALCLEPCEPCNKSCTKRLRCGHKCAGKCKEACFCFACEREYFVRWPPGIGREKAPDRPQSTIRLPRCRHIFTTAALDEYVKEKIKAFPYESSLPCPACKAPVFAWDTWRYRELLISHQENITEVKPLLNYGISHSCLNISKSDDMLIRHLKDVKDQRICFYSLMQGQRAFDFDKTGTFSRQIKLLHVTQKVTDQLDIFLSRHKTFSTNEGRTGIQRDVEALQSSLLHLGASMTRQKYRELKDRATRFFYMSNLLCAQHMLSKDKADDSLLLVVQKLLSDLIHNPRRPDIIPRVKTAIASCQSKTWWTQEQLTSLDILDAEPDMDLCEALNSLKPGPVYSSKLLSTDSDHQGRHKAIRTVRTYRRSFVFKTNH